MSSTRRVNLLNVLSYVAVIMVGVALLLSWVFKAAGLTGQLVGALNLIAQCLAYLVVACYSFSFARAKGIWWLIAWVVAVVLIVVFLVLGNI